MNLLLDECVPWPLRRALVGHTCRTAQQMGWGGIENGDLILQAELHFDLFITSDQNIRYQQNLEGRGITIIERSTNNLRRLLSAGELILNAVATAIPGSYMRLEIP